MKAFVTFCFLITIFSCLTSEDSKAQKLWAWGYNYYGQLGDYSNMDKTSPVPIAEVYSWVYVTTGQSHSIGLKTDGSLCSWGYNYQGQLGNNTDTNCTIPLPVGTAKDWAYVSAGGYFNLALKTNGTLWAWGWNMYGQLGDGSNNEFVRSPEQIGSDKDWVYIDAGYEHSLAIKKDGTLWAWGNNEHWQLGDGTTFNSRFPVRIGIDSNWLLVSAGHEHNLAIRKDGTLWAWGNNEFGQLGDGSYNNRKAPVQIGNDSDWTFISAGGWHNMALKKDGSLWAWGKNDLGQVGDTTYVNRNYPVRVGKDTGWSIASAGDMHCLALKTNGSLWGWGDNGWGQLGDGTKLTKNFSKQIGTTNNWIYISGSNRFSLAITGTSKIYMMKDSIPKFICGGSSFMLPFIANFGFNIRNTFYAVLSDENGSFANPTIIGELKSTIGGSIKASIPPNIKPGSKYRIKINATMPAINSTDNNYNITLEPAPVPQFSDFTNVCVNTTYSYTTPAIPGYSYKWTVKNGTIISGANSNTCNINWKSLGKGSVKLVLTSSLGCRDSTEKTIIIITKPKAEIIGPVTTCTGSDITFRCLYEKDKRYKWFAENAEIIGRDDSNYVNVKWKSEGTFKLKLIKSIVLSDCLDSTISNIIVRQGPPKPVINRQGKSLVSSSETNNQWFLDSMKLVDSTSNIIYPSKTGRYQLQVSKGNCLSEFSDEYYFDITEVRERTNLESIRIYPNPVNNDILNIELSENPYNTIIYEIISPLGITLQKGEINSNLKKIELSSLSSGLFYLILKQNSTQVVHKFIINR